MSYMIVQQIKIDEQKQEVLCKWDSNNVYPHDFTLRNWESGTRMLRERGRKYLDHFILCNYWHGNMQPGTNNRYSNAVSRFQRNNKQWTWDNAELFLPWYHDDSSEETEAQRKQHEKLLKEQNAGSITTIVDWMKPEFLDVLYQSYVEIEKIQ